MSNALRRSTKKGESFVIYFCFKKALLVADFGFFFFIALVAPSFTAKVKVEVRSNNSL